MGMVLKTKKSNAYTKTALALAISALSSHALGWDTPVNLHESDDMLLWDSNAPSYNIYEDGAYISTVHEVTSFGPIFNNSVYQVVAHDHGMEYSPLSIGYLFIDDEDDDDPDEEEEFELDEAEIYFELNNTDGDLGIHSLVDGGPWTHLVYEDLNGRTLMEIQLTGSLANQGLTEIFFESAEPTFDELSPADFFARFPGGVYSVEGVTVDGEQVEGEAELSQVMPAAPVVFIGANPTSASEGCADDPANDVTASLDVSGGLPVAWDPIVSHHPDIGVAGEVEVEQYQFVLEGEDVNLTVDLDSATTAFTVPAALVNSGDSVKFEVLVRDATHNQVATEACVNVI